MRKLHFCGIIAVILLNGCSPRITTKISTFYEPSVEAKDVIVYDMGQHVPNSAEVIGLVSVKDKGFLRSINYDESVDLAKQVVAKSGGNGLTIIDHIPASFWTSTMDQIDGQVLFLADTIIDIEKPNSFVIAMQKREEARKKYGPAHRGHSYEPGYRYKSPFLFQFASVVLPGLGQMLNEQYLKGALMSVGYLGGIALTVGISKSFNNSSAPNDNVVDTPSIFGMEFMAGGVLLAAGIWIWAIIDAPMTANRLNREHLLSLNLNGNASINLSPNLLQHKNNFTPALRLCLNF